MGILEEKGFEHNPDVLIRLFHDCFFQRYNTVLAYGLGEPIYLPANEQQPHHTIYFAHGFFSSALHECAHWLIAGKERRLLEDYGYWYIPDGRNMEEQLLFQQVEVKPQALEWLLSEAAGLKFHFSFDNLSGSLSDYDLFKEAVTQQKSCYEKEGLPFRARIFYQALLSGSLAK